MNHPEPKIEELQARLRILEQENAMLVDRAEDFLLLGLISEAVNTITDIEAMFAIALEKMALVKGIDMVAICRDQGAHWVVERSYDVHSDGNCDGLRLQPPETGIAPGADLLVTGSDCQELLGPTYPQISVILLLPFQAEIYGSGFLLLAGAEGSAEVFEQSRSLFCRALEILLMNVSNRLLLEKYAEVNAALDQKLAEQSQALETSEERFRTVIERAFEGFFLHNDEGRLLQVNQRACDSLGYSKAELLQLRVTDIDVSFTPEQYQTFLKGFDADNYLQLCSRHRRKDGVLLPVEINVSRVKLGDEYFYLALARDLTRQVEAEELQQQFDLLLDHMPDTVCMVSPQGEIRYLNRAARSMFGVDAEQAKQLYLENLMPEETVLNCRRQRLPEAISIGIWIGESILLSADKEMIPTLQTIVAPKNQLGQVENIFCIDRDLREFRRLEEQFIQAQKMEAVGTLVGGIAHDFNNLLAGIMGNVFLLLRQLKTGPEHDRLQAVQRMCQNAAGMVAQLLIFARKDVLSIAPLPLQSFMVEFEKMYQVLIPENIRFELSDIDEDMVVLTDVTQFQQVLVNLLTNARDALEDRSNPTIGVSVKRFTADEAFLAKHQNLKQRELVCISVIDNGCGIPPELQGRIFEPFFTTKAINKGTGLGMAMVFGAITRQGGTVEISSHVDQGTIVRLYLPRVHLAREHQQPDECQGLISGQGELLILADDDAFIRESYKDALIQLGYRVIAVADGRQAVDAYRSCPQVALVISDIVMPELDGISAGQMVRETDAALPLLYMTGYADKADRSKLLPAGAKIIKKPVTIQQLSQEIARLLGHC